MPTGDNNHYVLHNAICYTCVSERKDEMKIEQRLHGYTLEYTCECGCDKFSPYDARKNKDAVELDSMLGRTYFTCQDCTQMHSIWKPNLVKG